MHTRDFKHDLYFYVIYRILIFISDIVKFFKGVHEGHRHMERTTSNAFSNLSFIENISLSLKFTNMIQNSKSIRTFIYITNGKTLCLGLFVCNSQLFLYSR